MYRNAVSLAKQFRAIHLLIALFSIGSLGCQTTKTKNHVAIGNQYAKDGMLREAAESYKKALAAKPGNNTAHRNLGIILVKIGDYKAAARHLEKAMKRYEKDYDANYYLGEAYRAQDMYAEAIFRYQGALKIKPDHPKALKPLAWSYFKIRYYSESLTAAKKLVKVAPKDDQTSIILARTLLKLKRPKEALRVLRRGKKSIEKTSRPYYTSVEGDILYEMGNLNDAANAYRDALRIQPLLAGSLLGLGRVMMDQGNMPKAITYMERAIRIRPRLTEAHYLLGKIFEPKDPKRAMRYYSQFMKQASSDPEFLAKLNEVKTKLADMKGANQKK